ncbi:SusE domain-containing protein [Longitalea luteola]|uniref:SusE domain-containing protein n=1 Tax=Longitalea luteola TaxID=2812563 RepID=UPI001A97BB1D|nr:SusE domain-containing protein [Longitalea luteola]
MNNNNKLSIAFLSLLLAIFGCTKDNKFKEVTVTAVNTLYSPDDGRNVILQSAGSATLYFEWEKAVAEDNGVVYYDVLFDKHDGDFSNPVFVVAADNNGTSTGSSITHKVLNKIGKLAGIASGKEGRLKWTVASSRGLTRVVSANVRTINITRTNGIDAPDALFLTGEGTEGGSSLAQALTVKALPGGNEFEIYTRLLAGKKYTFVDSKTSVSRTFSVNTNGTSLNESADGATVAKEGVYRIHLDFTTASVTLAEITQLDFFMCTPQKRETLTYQGKGVWKVNDIVPDFTTNWSDDRYFFWMTIAGSEQKIGSSQRDNQPPATTTGSYFYLNFYPTDKNQWDYSFKFPNRSVKKCSIVVSFSPDAANYTHEVIY